MQTRQLRAGPGTLDLTIMGFGGAPLGNLYAPVAEAAARATLNAAWDAGIRVYDTAPLYGFGLSEERFGRFFSGRPRDAFVISTKIGRLLEELRAGGCAGVQLLRYAEPHVPLRLHL
jgi:D-threo-aldose 1-dehydrogenase